MRMSVGVGGNRNRFGGVDYVCILIQQTEEFVSIFVNVDVAGQYKILILILLVDLLKRKLPTSSQAYVSYRYHYHPHYD